MKQLSIIFLILTSIMQVTYGQSDNKLPFHSKYLRLEEGAEGSGAFRTVLSSDIDTTWSKWDLREYNFGFDRHQTPMYTTVDGVLSTPYMVQVRGNENEKNKKRWGYHVFEGYAQDDKSRITMLVNKHKEEGKPVAEMYYYGTVYNHSASAYNWFRIGSDVRQHSYLFSRDKAIFYGSLKMTNAFTLGKIGRGNLRKEPPQGDYEKFFSESAKHVNYQELKKSEDGTMFYDKDHNIVVIKIDGQWMKLAVEPLPDDIQYDFDQ